MLKAATRILFTKALCNLHVLCMGHTAKDMQHFQHWFTKATLWNNNLIGHIGFFFTPKAQAYSWDPINLCVYFLHYYLKTLVCAQERVRNTHKNSPCKTMETLFRFSSHSKCQCTPLWDHLVAICSCNGIRHIAPTLWFLTQNPFTAPTLIFLRFTFTEKPQMLPEV